MKLAIAATIILFSALPAQAQPKPGTVCSERSEMLALITGDYGEEMRSIGLGNGGLMETFANADTGSFTVTLTDANGKMCILAGGHNYDHVESVIEPQGDEG